MTLQFKSKSYQKINSNLIKIRKMIKNHLWVSMTSLKKCFKMIEEIYMFKIIHIILRINNMIINQDQTTKEAENFSEYLISINY